MLSIFRFSPPARWWLVGAGPGAPGLLSLLAYHGLQQADVIVYDALVAEGVLALGRADAERIYAGSAAASRPRSRSTLRSS